MVLHAYLKKTTQKGWGVFASRSFEIGEVVEISPVLLFKVSSNFSPAEEALQDYQLYWDDNNTDAFGFGYLMIYNHSDDPNVELERDYLNQQIIVRAIARIAEDDELVHFYKDEINFAVIE